MKTAFYSPAIAALLQEPRLAPLGPGTPNEAARGRLTGLTLERAFEPGTIRDRELAEACLAGLWLYHEFLDESHELSQQNHTPTGSYWHGLMHRREPDYDNARYWFRRVGAHPVFDLLPREAAVLTGDDELPPAAAFLRGKDQWGPFAFLSLCQAATTGRLPVEMLCRRIQQREWELLFDWCFRGALGAAP